MHVLKVANILVHWSICRFAVNQNLATIDIVFCWDNSPYTLLHSWSGTETLDDCWNGWPLASYNLKYVELMRLIRRRAISLFLPAALVDRFTLFLRSTVQYTAHPYDPRFPSNSGYITIIPNFALFAHTRPPFLPNVEFCSVYLYLYYEIA